ncbi:hypothetical protein LXL04_025821 [Taraxacum kok-saghyz]
MKIVKTRLRNKIGDQWLNDCLVTYIEKEIFETVPNESILKKIQKMCVRRFQLPTKFLDPPMWLGRGCHGPFLKGHAHWTMNVKDCPEKIFVFDFDNEIFKLFPSPPIEDIEESEINRKSLAVLKGCLWQSNTSGGNSEFTFWVMKEYGIKESWHKEVAGIDPIEHLRDGTILVVRYGEKLSAYSTEGRTIADTDYGFDHCFSAIAYRPSFLKLRNFESERVYVL